MNALFIPQEGATEEDDCVACEKGMYCSSWNLTMPEEKCEAGFYCSGGSNTSRPVGKYIFDWNRSK